jgi:hypothetical protein
MADDMKLLEDSLAGIAEEVASRTRLDQTPELLVVESGEDLPGLPGGSVCVVSGKREAALVRDAGDAARRGDAASLARALEMFDSDLRAAADEDRKAAEQRPPGEAFAALPTITGVSYRDKPLVEGLFVHPDVEAMYVTVPFAGGELEAEAFTASTYVRDENAPPVQTLVIVRQPELTPLEQKALERLPVEFDQVKVEASFVPLWVPVMVLAGIFLIGIAAGYELRQREAAFHGGPERDKANSGLLSEFVDEAELSKRLEGLEPGAAVKTLVELRASLMAQGQIR